MTGIDACLHQVMGITGCLGAALIDCSSGLLVAAYGTPAPGGHEEDGAGTTDVVRQVLAAPTYAAAGSLDVMICTDDVHHLLVRVPLGDGRVFLHLRLDPARGNLALARHGARAAISLLAPSGISPPPETPDDPDRHLLLRLHEGLRELT